MLATYSTSQLAEFLGCSAQSIRRTARSLAIEPAKDGKTFVFSDAQAQAIAAQLGKMLEDSDVTDEPTSDLEVNYLRELLEIRTEQINDLRKQVNDLIESNQSLQRQIDTLLETNKALSVDKVISKRNEILLGDAAEQPKKPWYKRLFG